MAAHGDTGEHLSTMDLSEHIRTWKGFIDRIKWSMLGVSLIMLFLAVFRTHG